MGNICGGDNYDQLKLKYKSQFVKYIITKNSINYLQLLTQKSKSKLTQRIAQLKSDKIKAIQTAQKQITLYFRQSQQKLSKQIQGGVKQIQNEKKAAISVILGYTSYKQKLVQLQSKVSQKYQSILCLLLNQMSQVSSYHIKKLNQDLPVLVIYNQMPIQSQNVIFYRGLKQYKQQVQKSQNHIRLGLGNKLDVDYHVGNVGHVLPQESIDGMVGLVKDKFQNYTQLLIDKQQH